MLSFNNCISMSEESPLHIYNTNILKLEILVKSCWAVLIKSTQGSIWHAYYNLPEMLYVWDTPKM